MTFQTTLFRSLSLSKVVHASLEPSRTTVRELDRNWRVSPWQLALSADAIERLLLFVN